MLSSALADLAARCFATNSLYCDCGFCRTGAGFDTTRGGANGSRAGRVTAGGFSIDQRDDGAILVAVSSLGLSFENDSGFVTLERNKGDDRSFLLRPSPCK